MQDDRELTSEERDKKRRDEMLEKLQESVKKLFQIKDDKADADKDFNRDIAEQEKEVRRLSTALGMKPAPDLFSPTSDVEVDQTIDTETMKPVALLGSPTKQEAQDADFEVVDELPLETKPVETAPQEPKKRRSRSKKGQAPA